MGQALTSSTATRDQAHGRHQHQKGNTTMSTTRTTERPRSLVGQLVNLTGTDPLDIRTFVDNTGYSLIKRLGLKPVAKVRTRRTTATGRHVIVAAPVRNKRTGEIEIGQKSVRRRGNGRSRRRQGTCAFTMHRWTLDQVGYMLANYRPRKVEYKQIQADALETYASITAARTVTLRRLPRARRWSKRR